MISFDRSGCGSKATTFRDARERDKTITMKDVTMLNIFYFQRMLRLRENKGVRTVL